tara:strand:- start:204 stop:479 length:276 start_codon:yes stop_codon:yes gene_type:complete
MIKDYNDKEKELLKPLAETKLDTKGKGPQDLEAQIEVHKKEVDTLKTLIDIKDIEIDKEKKAKELYFQEIKNLRKVLRSKDKLIKDLYKYP